MPPEHHLSSLVVHARPERRDEVADRLRSMGCEVHIASETGKLVVTLEADSARVLGDTMTAMQLLDGVLAATLVFHHVEPGEGLDRDVPQFQSTTEVGP
jgi:periplasmic nitrate reductase NapD